MLKALFGLAPQQQPDGSYAPSKLSLKIGVPDRSDYRPVAYTPYTGKRTKILVLCTEEKNMAMLNGKLFSTGNHPVETLVPMLHLASAGFEFEIVTPTGKPVVLETWAMPHKDEAVVGLHDKMAPSFQQPTPLQAIVDGFADAVDSYAAVYVPGGHGAMLGLPEDPRVDQLLRLAHEHGIFTITICHGPSAFLALTLSGQPFLYNGYKMAVFPDSGDKAAPKIGYLPGKVPWHMAEKLSALGVDIINSKMDDTCVVDRKLISGASPKAADALGKLAATTLLEQLT